jgi:hypothetical protein
MHSASVTKKSLFSAAICALLATTPAKAIIFDEGVSGDLSNNKTTPTALTLTPGSNSVIGTVNGFGKGDPQDWVSFTIPTGFVMISYVNFKYDSTDDQGFTGFAFGSSFPGGVDSEFDAANYAGYAHFGTQAQNPDGNEVIDSRREFAAADGRPKLRPGHLRFYTAARCRDIHLFDSAGRRRPYRLSI